MMTSLVEQEIAPALFTVEQTARFVGLSTQSLYRMRSDNHPSAPPSIRVGKRVLYPREGLERWIAERLAMTVRQSA